MQDLRGPKLEIKDDGIKEGEMKDEGIKEGEMKDEGIK